MLSGKALTKMCKTFPLYGLPSVSKLRSRYRLYMVYLFAVRLLLDYVSVVSINFQF